MVNAITRFHVSAELLYPSDSRIRANLTTRLAGGDCRGVSLTQAKLPRGNKLHVSDAKTGLTQTDRFMKCAAFTVKKRQETIRAKEQLSYKTLAFQGWVCALEACRLSHGWARLQCMFYTEARRRNSLDRSEEQTGQDQSVDEADIDPVSPTGLWRSFHMWCSSRALISFLWNESSVSLHVQQEVLSALLRYCCLYLRCCFENVGHRFCNKTSKK